MWHDVDTKWNAHQETLKTKAIRQEVEQISEVVNLVHSQENEFNKLMEEINSLDGSIDASITRASNADTKAATENERVKQGVKDGSIPSAVVDSGTTSNVMKPGDPCIKTGRKSSKQYKMATGQITPGGEEGLLEHELRDPARSCDIVPGITEDSLVSTSKMADAGYISIFDGEEVNIYDASNTQITVTRGAVLRGWRDATCGLWRIPLVKNVTNKNAETVLVKAPPTELLPNRPGTKEAVHNVYELKTKPEMIRYYHAATGFPTKRTWLSAIKCGNFVSWPGLTVDAARKHFPESEETQKGHMRTQPQGLRSTKIRMVPEALEPDLGEENVPVTRLTKKENDVFVRIYELQDEMRKKIYTDQTGCFPTRSSRGNQYIMVMCEMDSDVILFEPMKNRTAGEMI